MSASKSKVGIVSDGEYYLMEDITYPEPAPCADGSCNYDGGGQYSQLIPTDPLMEDRVVKRVIDIDTGVETDTIASSFSVARYIYKIFFGGDGCVGEPIMNEVYQCSNYPVAGESSYSDAYTTDRLKTRTVEALPEYPDTWEGSCSAYRNLASNEFSYSIRKFKWRMKHAPSGTCYLKVWLRRKFQPEGGGAPSYTEIAPYVWTGNPCIADKTKAPSHDDNIVKSDPSEEDVPLTDGTVTVEIVKYSFVSGYEPNISDPANKQPNGFPDPTWTA